jgi:hypothetical protein
MEEDSLPHALLAIGIIGIVVSFYKNSVAFTL